MSADNGVYYRPILGKWWVMHGFASDERCDCDYIKRGYRFGAKEDCLRKAEQIHKRLVVCEYGIIPDYETADDDKTPSDNSRLEAAGKIIAELDAEIGRLRAIEAAAKAIDANAHQCIGRNGITRRINESDYQNLHAALKYADALLAALATAERGGQA